MPGIHVTDRQVRRYMSSREDGYSQAAAAARAGFSERTGRRIEAKPVLPSQREGRRYRTRPDPFADVWLNEVVPMLEAAPQIRRGPRNSGSGVVKWPYGDRPRQD